MTNEELYMTKIHRVVAHHLKQYDKAMQCLYNDKNYHKNKKKHWTLSISDKCIQCKNFKKYCKPEIDKVISLLFFTKKQKSIKKQQSPIIQELEKIMKDNTIRMAAEELHKKLTGKRPCCTIWCVENNCDASCYYEDDEDDENND